MITLVDGPCAGSYAVRRAPLLLRAVVGVRGSADVRADVLDQLTDTPEDHEGIHVYLREGPTGSVHIQLSTRSRSGFYATGSYKHLSDVDGEQFRDNATWQSWAEAQPYCRGCGLDMRTTLDPEAEICAPCAEQVAIRNRSFPR